MNIVALLIMAVFVIPLLVAIAFFVYSIVKTRQEENEELPELESDELPELDSNYEANMQGSTFDLPVDDDVSGFLYSDLLTASGNMNADDAVEESGKKRRKLF